MIDHLHRGKVSAVIEHDKAKLLAGADGAHPAADFHFPVGILFGVFKQIADADQFHNKSLSNWKNI